MSDQRDRDIFQYFNGECEAWGDPLAIHRRLTLALGGHPNRYIEQAKAAEELVAAEAEEKLDEAIRIAFRMVPFDPLTGSGATENHCRAALAAYADFLEKKNPSGATLPSPSPSSESWLPSSTDEPTTMEPMSVYGQTSNS